MAVLNGDGLPDLLVKKFGEPIQVQFNLGSRFAPPTTRDTPDWGVELSPIVDGRAAVSRAWA